MEKIGYRRISYTRLTQGPTGDRRDTFISKSGLKVVCVSVCVCVCVCVCVECEVSLILNAKLSPSRY